MVKTTSGDPPKEDQSIEEAWKLFSSEDYQRSFFVARNCWLSNPEDKKAIELFALLMKKAGLNELANNIDRLTQEEGSITNNLQLLVEVATRLIDERQHDLAAMLFKRCQKLLPDEPFINYELGFALMSLGHHQEAITYFSNAASKRDDFDTRLNLAVSYICTRQTPKAKEMIQRMSELVADDEQKDELSHRRLVLKRLEGLNNKESLNARDWQYILYGSILLNQSQEAGLSGKFKAVWSDYSSIASTLLVLRSIVEGLGESFEIVEFYSSVSEPLAIALADLMGIPCEVYKEKDRVERTLLLMAWASDVIGAHEALKENKHNRVLFAYGLTSTEWLPVTPEITGCLSEACAMPWSEHWKIEQPNDGSSPKVEHVKADKDNANLIAKKILERARALESDTKIIQETQEALAYYRPKRELLVIGNPEMFKQRCQYSAEAPI